MTKRVKTYKSRRWAYRAAAKLPRHKAELQGDGRYHIRPMTEKEWEEVRYLKSLNDILLAVYRPAITAQLNQSAGWMRNFRR